MKNIFTRSSIFFILLLTSIIAENDFVSVNQVGYLPTAEKYFITNVKVDTFYVVSKIDNNIVFTGKADLLASNDFSTGMTTYKGTFTEFETDGEYFVRLKTGLESYSFKISENVFDEVYNKVMLSYYLQRCGVDLDQKYAGDFARPACHNLDAYFHPSTFLNGIKDVSGGWHDAGDYGKYVHNSAVSLGIMLLAYEQFPKKHQLDNLNIDESGNSIPDFLDECRYQLEWILKMQDSDEGGVHYMVNTKNYTWSMPHKDSATRYLYGISSVSTGGFAAITAMAARIYEPYDKEFSTRLLDAAKFAWDFLEKYPVLVPTNGFKRPSDTHTGGYAGWADSNDKDERLWAAVELFITTGDEKYGTYSESYLSKATSFSDDFSWLTVYAYPKLSYMLSEESFINSTIKSNLRSKFLTRCNALLTNVNNDGFHSGLTSNEYYWGSNGTLLGRGAYFIIAHLLSGEQKFYDAALRQLNYILGVNGHNFSFVGKLGTNSVENIHHAALETDGIHDIYPGLLAGGPNKNIDNDPILQNNFSTSTPAALCYIDHSGSYASNENCIFYSAPLVFVSAFFSTEKNMTSVSSINSQMNDSELEIRNYPNPFNNSTKIFFNLGFEDDLDFVIYDMLGRKIFNKRLGVLSSGNHEVSWDSKNNSGNEVSSGVYVYSIEGEKVGLKQGKMILLK